jgi:type IV fimbrial biogenesis protein FimT
MEIHGHGTGSKRSPGFTVLELMIAVSVACILILTGMPSFQAFSQRQSMKAAIGHLHNDLLVARSEAVARGLFGVACPGDPVGGCSGAYDWSDGWIVFADRNGDQQFQSTESLIRHGQALEGLRIMGSSGRRQVRFFPNGSAPGSNGSIHFCGTAGPPEARKLVISNLGRIRRDTATGIDPLKCPDSA